MELHFKFELGQLVAAKPFRHQGRMIIPPSMERYKVVGRFYSEGIRPDTKMIDAAICYHVQLQGLMFKEKKIATIKETDLQPWHEPKDDEGNALSIKSGAIL